MRQSILIATVVVITGGLSACSGGSAPDPVAHPDAREIRLVAPPGAETPLVSDLEAGRPLDPARSRPVERSSAALPPAAPVAEEEAIEPVQVSVAMDGADSALVEAPSTLVTESPAVAAPAEEPPRRIIEAPWPPAPLGGYGPPLGLGDGGSSDGGSPRIIIRGGRGGVHDDCHLGRRPVFGRPGVAINRRTPQLFGEETLAPREILGRTLGAPGPLGGRIR